MNSFILSVVILACFVALVCVPVGVFVVLRKSSMLVDAMSHAVFPGIVFGYALVADLKSPILVIGAALASLIVIAGHELLMRTKIISGDASQGLIYPALFSIGVILVTLEFANTHLDVHAVLVGDINLAATHHLKIGKLDLGPEYTWLLAGLAILEFILFFIFARALSASTFDRSAALLVGNGIRAIEFGFIFLVAVVVTIAFYATGAILIIAFIVVPAAAARILTKRLFPMLFVACAMAILSAVFGFWVAYEANAPTSAGIAVVCGLVFALVFFIKKIAEYIITSRALKASLSEPATGIEPATH